MPDLTLGLWNLQDLGGGPGRQRREPLELAATENAIGDLGCDILGILEVKTRHQVQALGTEPPSQETRLWVLCHDILATYVFRCAARSLIDPDNQKELRRWLEWRVVNAAISQANSLLDSDPDHPDTSGDARAEGFDQHCQHYMELFAAHRNLKAADDLVGYPEWEAFEGMAELFRVVNQASQEILGSLIEWGLVFSTGWLDWTESFDDKNFVGRRGQPGAVAKAYESIKSRLFAGATKIIAEALKVRDADSWKLNHLAKFWPSALDSFRRYGRSVAAWRVATDEHDNSLNGRRNDQGFKEFSQLAKGNRLGYWPTSEDECWNSEKLGECVGLMWNKEKVILRSIFRIRGFGYRSAYKALFLTVGRNPKYVQIILYHAPSSCPKNASWRARDFKFLGQVAADLYAKSKRLHPKPAIVLMADLNIATDAMNDENDTIDNAGTLTGADVFGSWTATAESANPELPYKFEYTTYRTRIQNNTIWSHAFDKIVVWSDSLAGDTEFSDWQRPAAPFPLSDAALRKLRKHSDHCPVTARLSWG